MTANNITTHRDEDRVVTWVEVSDGYHAAFMKDDSGEVLETVEFTHGLPDWEEAGCTDPALANDPELLAEVTRRLS